jgi:acyl-CoA:acyl-CoA alkyltransferase
MRYQNVCLEALGYALPSEILTSEEIEDRLAPLYDRLKLPHGRLELMSGIRQRRLWPRGMRPSEQSVVSGTRAIAAAGIDPMLIGALVHGSVCRDYLEPATACSVHDRLELSEDCLIYDVSNACLGLLNGLVQVANMIELGQIRAGLVVGTEDSRQLLESTIDALNRDTTLTRKTVKPAFASLTIGSASAAMLLVHKEISRSGNQLTSVVARAHTHHHDLCQGGHEADGGGSAVLMQTDSEQLLQEGIATGAATFEKFLNQSGWSAGGENAAARGANSIDKTICHQVGAAHRNLMLQSLGLSLERDYSTFPWLGNTGSAALPVTLALAAESGFVSSRDRVALLGIGSGINCLMASVQWQKSLVGGEPAGQTEHWLPAPHVPLVQSARSPSR